MSSRLEHHSCGVKVLRMHSPRNAKKHSHSFHSRLKRIYSVERADDEREARSMDQPGTLAQLFSQGLEHKGMTVETVAERTKVPRSTLRVLLGATDPAILPQRVYLRGHVGVVAKELGIELAEAFARFDLENP